MQAYFAGPSITTMLLSLRVSGGNSHFARLDPDGRLLDRLAHTWPRDQRKCTTVGYPPDAAS